MKKISILFLLALSTSFIIFGCKKDDEKEQEQEETSNSVVAFNFNESSDLNAWSFYSNDTSVMLLDTENKTEGAASLFVNGGCCSIMNETGYSVSKNTNYKISLDVKFEELPDGVSCGGAFYLALVVIRGDDSEWFSLYKESEGWYSREFYFNSGEYGLPIQFRIYQGRKNLWIDQFVVEEVDLKPYP